MQPARPTTPSTSAQPQVPVPPPPTTTTMDAGTQTSRATPSVAGSAPPTPAPPSSVPTTSAAPQDPASSARSGISSAAVPPQHPTQQQPAAPPAAPWGHHPSLPLSSAGPRAPPAMAAPNAWYQPFCYMPPHMQQPQQQQQQYWYYYPGTVPGAGLPMTCTRPSPWWSGTSHHLTNPPPRAPQVYTVEPAYIMPQATYYQAAMPAAGAAPTYYYVAGQPTYYYC
ncbi:hypothetical protein F5Y01DRAFT_328088 [Xylaria sp. FL0043]|nr:hypothetical protein F5Y01DRAFT_328088 [Xylaria sp. FL0043]